MAFLSIRFPLFWRGNEGFGLRFVCFGRLRSMVGGGCDEL